ncbi:2-keto-4-pentenoate hydratase [Ideonella sp. A 288]|uniref:2-keto-4-pentenoate hydratase n=1 Tax=Ideonella sp. A 288 TaxID=1962181 RepID=UPI000B4C1A85|nr:hydratase [Ideonella sp. A 288]
MTPHDLLSHIDNGRPWAPAGPSTSFTDPAAAYQAALAVRTLRLARGEVPRGFKIGFTNRTIWARYQVFAPIWGTVWDTTLAFANDQGEGTLSLDATCQPRLEPEVVFGLKATPRAEATLDDLFDALDWVAPGFEVVQSHRPGWTFSAADTMADSGLHARLLVGRRVPVSQVARDAAQLHAVLAGARVGLYRGDTLVEEGVGANVLDSPLHALAHFLKELRACPGAPDLQPGDVVTTGTWTDAWPVQAGERWTSTRGAPLSDLSVTFR